MDDAAPEKFRLLAGEHYRTREPQRNQHYSTGRTVKSRWLYPVLATALIGVFLLQALLSIGYMSATYDEPVYIAAGYSYWKTRDGRLGPEHPPLVKLLVAMPLLPLGLAAPTDDRSWREGDKDDFAIVFLRRNLAILDQIMFRSRLSILFIGLLLAVFVRKWASELWGAEAGLAALLLFAFEPNTLAHSALATLDTALTTFMFISMFYVWKWLRTGRARYAMLASVALGFSLLSKGTTLAFLPIFLAEFVLDYYATTRRGLPGHVAPITGFLRLLAGAVVVVTVVYAVAFHWHPLLGVHGQQRTASSAVQTRIIALGQRIWIPAVDSYVKGALVQQRNLIADHASFLMGRYSLHGWWYYYPVAFLIKTPLPILLLVVLRLSRLASFPWIAEEYLIVLPIIGVMILACFNPVDYGLRYVLPLYPFLFVWLSRIVALEVFGGRDAGS